MHPTELIPAHVKRHLTAVGYNEIQADDAAENILTKYKRSQIKATEFLKEAEKYAKEQFGKPKRR